ncbi:restriction endonuclease subunit S [Treponema endosymbiont of Eucomonympha sp.]|uniref:restriction endonuclease subunit S n=1 Tax=Treponema endosymbiont of Eucomonympha sp. TaxID=1580831 RepID=UPI000B245573|nr:restriction endonuclease subunit S [Treponema endosymbiont of Eucomonympha sp.]
MNSPFDEATYKALLEGLEIAEISLNELKSENQTFRFDSEYLKKEYLLNIQNLKSFPSGYIRLNNAIKYMSGGATPLGAEYQENEEISFLRVQNIMQNYFNLDDVVYISQKQDEEIKRSRLEENDVLLTITGSYGKSTVVPLSLVGANINQHSVKITLNSNINPYFLSTFLNSKQGKLQSDKNIVGVTRPALDYEVIRNFLIPILPQSFQFDIQSMILKSKELSDHSQSLYRQAESLLLQEIGLQDFAPSSEKCNIKSFKESFGATGRLDAEYYQRKYEDIIAKVKAQHYDLLGDLVTIKKSIEPGSNAYSDTGIPFVRVADYNQFGISSPDIFLSEKFCKENAELLKTLYPQKGTILFSKDGSVGTAYMLREDMRAITSGALLHLTVKDTKKVLPGYLTLVLNTTLVKHLAERDAGGSIILHWRIDEIKQVVIPIIAYDIQQQIAALIAESFRLREESERLLEQAKAAVEQEIERESECL